MVELKAALDARKARESGEDWTRFAARTSNVPLVAIAQRRNTLALGEIGAVKIIFGLIVYGGMLVLHPMLFGAAPW